MAAMPPLEDDSQPINIHLQQPDAETLQLANKAEFEVIECSNYEKEVKEFVRNLSANNRGSEPFRELITYLHPLSITHRNVFARHCSNRGDLITHRGWNVIKSASDDLDETSIVCYLIEYSNYARNMYEKEEKRGEHKKGKKESESDGNHEENEQNENLRKQIFDKLNNAVRSKLRSNCLSLDVLSLVIACHFISNLSPKTDGFTRTLLSKHLPNYLLRFPLNATQFIRLFDSVIYQRKQFHDKKLIKQFFEKINENMAFLNNRIAATNDMDISYDHLFSINVVHYILKQLMSIHASSKSNSQETQTLPEPVEKFMIHLTEYAMNRFINNKQHSNNHNNSSTNNAINGEFVCLMLSVYHCFSKKLPAEYLNNLSGLCRDLFRDRDKDRKLDIILFSKLLNELDKCKQSGKFLHFIARKKDEFVNGIFDREIIKRSGIQTLQEIMSNRYAFNLDLIQKDAQFIHIKKSFVCIAVKIAKQYSENTESTASLLSICAKSLVGFDKFVSKFNKITTIFDKTELQQIIWCFGFARYRNDKFWKDLCAKVQRLKPEEIDMNTITKFSWSIARVKAYLVRYRKEDKIHSSMIWCVKNCVDVIAKHGDSSFAEIFTLEQLSTICWAISVCGKPPSRSLNDHHELIFYIKLFHYIASNTWEIIDSGLQSNPQFYCNILNAILVFKDVLLGLNTLDDAHQITHDQINASNPKSPKKKTKVHHSMLIEVSDDDNSDSENNLNSLTKKQRHHQNNKQCVADKITEFVMHVLNQFNATQNGQQYMKSDPKVIEFLLHITAEFREPVYRFELENNKNVNGGGLEVDMHSVKLAIPKQMMIQISKMLSCLSERNVEISLDCAFSIVCTLSRIPYCCDALLMERKCKVINDLCTVIINQTLQKQAHHQKEKKRKSSSNSSTSSSSSSVDGYVAVEHLLGMCSAICAQCVCVADGDAGGTQMQQPYKWDPFVIDHLVKSTKFWLHDQSHKWTEDHFLLKQHLNHFLEKFNQNGIGL